MLRSAVEGNGRLLSIERRWRRCAGFVQNSSTKIRSPRLQQVRGERGRHRQGSCLLGLPGDAQRPCFVWATLSLVHTSSRPSYFLYLLQEGEGETLMWKFLHASRPGALFLTRRCQTTRKARTHPSPCMNLYRFPPWARHTKLTGRAELIIRLSKFKVPRPSTGLCVHAESRSSRAPKPSKNAGWRERKCHGVRPAESSRVSLTVLAVPSPPWTSYQEHILDSVLSPHLMRAVGSACGTNAWADPTQASTATVDVNFIVLLGGVCGEAKGFEDGREVN